MVYALDDSGARIKAERGAAGLCPGCRESLIAKCGEIKVHHWAHRAGDCDPWYEPETEWHQSWKSLAPKERCEVVIGPHRADVVSREGIVVELQHSLIWPEEARERERFYQRMVWLFDAKQWETRLDWINRGSPGRPFVAFRWKQRRAVHWQLTMPIFWDFGLGQILAIKGMHPAGGGSGQWIHKVEFVNRYF